MGEQGRETRSTSRHHHREDLAGEHKWGDAGQLILLFLFFVVWIADSFFLHRTTLLAHHVPVFVRVPVGIVILIFAWELARRGLRVVFGEERAEPAVISAGVFDRVRHPVYLGTILLYLGLIVTTLSLVSFIFWLAIILFYHFISRHEEGLLLKKFGPEYEAYQLRVPMWIPSKKNNHHRPHNF